MSGLTVALSWIIVLLRTGKGSAFPRILFLQCTPLMTINRAKIESSILAPNTTVRSKAELVKCVTQAGFEVDASREFFIVFISLTRISLTSNFIRY